MGVASCHQVVRGMQPTALPHEATLLADKPPQPSKSGAWQHRQGAYGVEPDQQQLRTIQSPEYTPDLRAKSARGSVIDNRLPY